MNFYAIHSSSARKDEPSLVPLRRNNNVTQPTKTKQSEGLREEEYDLVPDLIIDHLPCGSKTEYKKNSLLGTGGFAKVYMVTEMKSGSVFADKIISKEFFKRKASAEKKVQNEIDIHIRLDHVNIVQFHKYFEDCNYIHILMEICTNRTLVQVLKNRETITEPEARYYLKQIMEGTRYLHLHQILHRDLKLGNMFLHRDMTLKIGDFGLATKFRQNNQLSMCGTPNYIAPEVLYKQGHGVSSDIWAVGCILFALLCGYPPFETKGKPMTQSLKNTYKKIKDGDFKIPNQANLTDNARDMIELMLHPDPEKRGHLGMPNQDDFDDLFQQPFLLEFIPSTLPSSAIRTVPDLEDELKALERGSLSNHAKSSAVSITGRRPTNEDAGCGSFSPIFSPSSVQLGSTLKQKFGSLFDKKTRFIQRVHDAVAAVVELQGDRQSRDTRSLHTHLPVFVSKWVDYSNTFGFGYQLSNNAVGLLFNDSTRMGCTPDRKEVEFIDMKGKNFLFSLEGPIQYGYDLKMRVGILKSVINYMEDNLHDSGKPLQGMTGLSTNQKSLVPHLKKWSRRRGAVSMELSNNTVQVNHLEAHCKLIIFETGVELYVTLLDKNKSVMTHSLSTLLTEGCPETLYSWLTLTLPEIRHLANQ
ncbi:serine/threonine-protein kinase PLK2 isoform X2 [Eurytemora carolleeae]|uniref:serine/threonine-protein kinase PLK2 isoform X2 n=1 Tax=Eurytemora carolleeae TaxID=1294199 RepID=UPI000C776BF4|nr:serine/threonine-protein kinase PLK2 isoform X2 [Eurytemora carolleeae]|eukprot:XP_023333665.1 serine/threonine-protein kinase PLK2-like isoform X2 [Eurytemora affinis]